MNSLNYHHLRYFWSVAQEGNLTRAAERLRVSQSAISVQIQSLEDTLGHPLFERRGKQLILTEAGRIVFDHADAIFSLGDELVGTLQTQGGITRKILRIGALATLSRNFQIGFLKPLIGREDVELILRSGGLQDLLQNLEAHRLDVVLANNLPPRDGARTWVAHVIADQHVSLVGHPDQAKKRRKLKDLLAHEPLVLPGIESSIRIGFDALVDRLGVKPSIAAEVDDMAMLRLVAREHQGLAVVPSIVVKDELDKGVLVEIEKLSGLKETFFAITLTRRFPSPLLKNLISHYPRKN